MTDEKKATTTQETAAKKDGVAKKEKAKREPRVTENGVARPGKDTKTGIVWAIADKLSQAMGKPAGRKAVLEQAEKQAINAATAATQYGRWRKFNGLIGNGVEAEKPESDADEAA
jgi:hypothetical protein